MKVCVLSSVQNARHTIIDGDCHELCWITNSDRSVYKCHTYLLFWPRCAFILIFTWVSKGDYDFSSSEVWTANKANRSKRDFVYLSQYYLVSFAHPMSSHPLSIFFFTWKIKRELRENILFSIWNYIFILQSSKKDKKR